MAREDWDYIPLPKEMLKELDRYLASSEAKRYGIRSRAELLRFIVRRFIDEYTLQSIQVKQHA
ncbi:MAG: ribbon-helix-helix domain-containing protein [Candidatus Nitrosocaldus sp.]